MGKSAPSPPAAPDPAETARAQGAINKETAITQASLNRINQITPQGTLTYTQTPGSTFDAERYLRENQDVARDGWNAMEHYTKYGQSEGRKVYDTTGNVWSGSSDVPRYTQTITLSPEQQKLYDLQTQAQTKTGTIANEQLGRVSDALSQPVNFDNAPAQVSQLDTSGLVAMPSGQIGDYAADRQKVEDALMARINPSLDKDRAALEQRLANQGITIGSQAYNSAIDETNRKGTDARNQAILSAGQEQTRLVNQEMAMQQLASQLRGQGFTELQVQAALQNAARQQSIQETLTKRNQPINETTALMSGSQVSMPQFAGVPQVQVSAPDYQGAAALKYQGDLASYNSNMQSQNAAMGGLFGLGGSILSAGMMPGGFFGMAPLAASDRRVKKNIRKEKGTIKGHQKYSFEYIWGGGRKIGVMAQEVQKINPAAITTIGGIMHVNYGAL